MGELSKYNNTTVRVVCDNGDVFCGAAECFPAEYGLHEFGTEEESLRIGEYTVFADEIREIEIVRNEACFPVRDWPEAKEEIALWFHERWKIPLEAYRDSINECIGEEGGIPQWYVVVRGDKIIAGCGVIENDFHKRKDLTPNVCAVYVDEEYRNQGIAGFMLDYVCEDMKAMGCDTLYLLTDHTGFYERYGWKYLCDAANDDGNTSRMYVHKSKKKLLLHSCCGPCSTAVIERLSESGEYDITVYYFNPNITDPEEYEHRRSEQIRLIKALADDGLSVDYIDGDYDPAEFFGAAKGLEEEKEGGARCRECFKLRLCRTARLAKEQGFDCFDTTLSVSPHKNYDVISDVAAQLAEEFGVEYLSGNYKKKDGYKRSTELANKYGLYRQHYCGCEFSKPAQEKDNEDGQ